MTWLKMGVCLALFGGFAMAAEMASAGSAAGVLEGQWGGDRLRLVIGSNNGRIEMDCASGTINGPINLTADGKFVASGTFEQHQGGPQRADEAAVPANARYSGEVKQDAMKLSILPAGGGAATVFNLRKGAAAKLVRCL
jgi:hypothetical protein